MTTESERAEGRIAEWRRIAYKLVCEVNDMEDQPQALISEFWDLYGVCPCCDKPTMGERAGDFRNMFMVHDELWAEVCHRERIDPSYMLHWACFEMLMGRDITIEDLNDAAVNGYHKDRLMRQDTAYLQCVKQVNDAKREALEWREAALALASAARVLINHINTATDDSPPTKAEKAVIKLLDKVEKKYERHMSAKHAEIEAIRKKGMKHHASRVAAGLEKPESIDDLSVFKLGLE